MKACLIEERCGFKLLFSHWEDEREYTDAWNVVFLKIIYMGLSGLFNEKENAGK